MESDHELAFRLQMEEAIAASLSLPHSPATVDGNTGFVVHRRPPVVRFDLDSKRKERELIEADHSRMRFHSNRLIRDQNFTHQARPKPDVKPEDFGDQFKMPSGEGSSSGSRPLVKCEPHRLYFKGLLSEENVGNSMVTLYGIGVAICDPRGNLIFELKKPVRGVVNRKAAELEALLEGLAMAFSLDFKRLIFYCD